MLYSIGKDSSVMLHLARKAFYPARPPFPLLHVDTTWKFREMYAFRDRMARGARRSSCSCTSTRTALAQGINPFTHGSAVHTDVMKTQGAEAGARQVRLRRRVRRRAPRRGEDRAPRSASSRSAPRSTAGTRRTSGPELWRLYNARKQQGRVASASFRSRTGPSSTSGSTSTARTSRSCRSTSPRSGRSSSATAR